MTGRPAPSTDSEIPIQSQNQASEHALGPTDPRAMALALLIGGTGGALFFWIGMPLAWMMGAAVFCTVAALSGARIGVEPRLRQVMLVVLGVMLGGGFSPGLLSRLPEWGVTICLLMVLTIVSAAACGVFFRRVGGYDRTTAFFSGIPGGLAEMTTIGAAMGGDERRISLAHGVRILVVVMTIPFWFRLHDGITTTSGTGVHFGDLSWHDVGILLACGLIGAPLARLMRLPAAMILGPMLLSAAAHYSGLTKGHPPAELVAIAQVVIGTAIGCRFTGISGRTVMRALWLSVVGGVIGVLVAIAFTVLAIHIVDLRYPGVLLSFSPGGVAEMSLVALALHVDTAMVAAHHLFRIFFVVIVAPMAWRLFLGRRGYS